VKNNIEKERELWADIAKEYGWYTHPFYVQVWIHEDGTIIDSVSFKGLKEDIIINVKKGHER